MTTTAISQAEGSRTRPVLITVNKKPVKIEGQKVSGLEIKEKVSGLEIKEIAIMEGVAIKLDFHLAMLGPDGKYDPVGDAEVVEVSSDSEFVATAGDDNS